MSTTGKRMLAAMAFAFCAMCFGNAFAGEWITPDRNIPVDNDYKEIGDQKYDDRMYRDYYQADTFDGTGRLNTPADTLEPDRNLPVRNDFKNVDDKQYSPHDFQLPYQQGADNFSPRPLIAPGDRNLPVDSDYKDIGDPNFGGRESVRP